jgi:lysozyme family protein
VKKTLMERFMDKVSPDPNTGCWLWTGYIEPGGYGMLWMPGNRSQNAHRVSWNLHYGEIPAGAFVCHRCDTRNCVNPKHLFLCNAAENAADMKAKGRSRCGERNTSAKLTGDEVRQMRALIDDGSLSIGAIADKFNVSRATVYAIRKKKVWRGADGREVFRQDPHAATELQCLEETMAEFKPAFDFVMNHEDPHRTGKVTEDAGGRTRFGIAQKFHPELTDEFFTGPVEDALKQAEEILRGDYWRPMRLDEIRNQNVANKLFDMAVNMGVHQAGVYAQRAANGFMDARGAQQPGSPERAGFARVGVETPKAASETRVAQALLPVQLLTEDGILGERSVAAINSLDPIAYYQLLCDFSRQHYIHVASNNPAQAVDLQGWLKRATA